MNPKVSLLAKSSFNAKEFIKLLKYYRLTWRRSRGASQAEELVEVAGRVCYMSFGKRQSPKSNKEYIQHLIASGHESVLEHVSWTFLVTGVSRAFTHQFVRHRIGFSYSQLSQQYHDEEDADFVVPYNMDKFPEAMKAWEESIKVAKSSYVKIRNAVIREENRLPMKNNKREIIRAMRSMARSVLPNSTETKIVVTANARSLRNYLNARGSIIGDSEMRIVSACFLEILQKDSPELFSDFKLKHLDDNSPIVVREKH